MASSKLAGLPVVAVVGRPNVGKSTLFNRIVGRRQAIVEDRARTTRDRMYGDSDWNGRRFIIVDTGGLEVDPADRLVAPVADHEPRSGQGGTLHAGRGSNFRTIPSSESVKPVTRLRARRAGNDDDAHS